MANAAILPACSAARGLGFTVTRAPRAPPRTGSTNSTALGVRFRVEAVSPANSRTPLQMVCFFDWRRNSRMQGGTGELNERLHDGLRAIRRAGDFRGEAYETLLLVPPPNLVRPKRLLLFGLGDPRSLSSRQFTRLGASAVHEATRLRVRAFALAPDIHDAGVTFDGGQISGLIVSGMIGVLRTLEHLRTRGFVGPRQLQQITLLAGHEHFERAADSIRKTVRRAPGLADLPTHRTRR